MLNNKEILEGLLDGELCILGDSMSYDETIEFFQDVQFDVTLGYSYDVYAIGDESCHIYMKLAPSESIFEPWWSDGLHFLLNLPLLYKQGIYPEKISRRHNGFGFSALKVYLYEGMTFVEDSEGCYFPYKVSESKDAIEAFEEEDWEYFDSLIR